VKRHENYIVVDAAGKPVSVQNAVGQREALAQFYYENRRGERMKITPAPMTLTVGANDDTYTARKAVGE